MANDNVTHHNQTATCPALAALAVLVIAIVLTMLSYRTQCNLIDRCSDHAANRNHHRLQRSDYAGAKVGSHLILAGLAAVLLFSSVVDYKLCHCLQIVIVIALVIAFGCWRIAAAEDIRFSTEIITDIGRNPALIANRWSGGGKSRTIRHRNPKARAMGIKPSCSNAATIESSTRARCYRRRSGRARHGLW